MTPSTTTTRWTTTESRISFQMIPSDVSCRRIALRKPLGTSREYMGQANGKGGIAADLDSALEQVWLIAADLGGAAWDKSV